MTPEEQARQRIDAMDAILALDAGSAEVLAGIRGLL